MASISDFSPIQNLTNLATTVKHGLERVNGSFFCKAFTLGTATLVSGIYTWRISARSSLPITLTVATLALAYLTYKYVTSHYKQLRNEYGLSRNIIQHYRGKYNWFSIIIPNKLIISGLPLENFGHRQKLKDLGVTHILSIVEDEEFEPKLLTYPIKHVPNEHWLQIRSPDHEPLSIQDLDQAVKWLQQAGLVLDHCKSGKGRSVMAAIAWLALYGPKEYPEMQAGTDPQKIYKHIQEHIRPEINLSKEQMNMINQFVKQFNH